MSLRNFDFKEEFFFAKRVIAAHMSLKHLIPVILSFLSILGPQVTSDTKMLFKRQKFQFRPVKNWVLGEKFLHVKNEQGGKCVKNEETGIVNTFNNGNQLVCCQ